MLQASAFAKARRSWGASLILPRGGKIAALRGHTAEAALLDCSLWCSAGRTGSAGYAADRTPAGAGARPRWGAGRCAVCRQMRGVRAPLANGGARPIRVGSLRSPVLARRRVLKMWTSATGEAKAAGILNVWLRGSLSFRGSHQYRAGNATPGTPGGSSTTRG